MKRLALSYTFGVLACLGMMIAVDFYHPFVVLAAIPGKYTNVGGNFVCDCTQTFDKSCYCILEPK